MTYEKTKVRKINLARLMAENLENVFCIPRAAAERYANGFVRNLAREIEDGIEIDYTPANFPVRVIRL
jgi:hypothetical protein